LILPLCFRSTQQVGEDRLCSRSGQRCPAQRRAGFPVQGEQHFTEFVNGDIAWNLSPQGQPVRQSAVGAADRQLVMSMNPIGFINAGLAATNAAATDR
jgi:hypothetical protein